MGFLDWYWEFAGLNALISENPKTWWQWVELKIKLTQYFTLIMPVLCLSLTIRRLHDRGHSGWLVLMYLLPLGWLLLALIAAMPGGSNANAYGAAPQSDSKAHYAYYRKLHFVRPPLR